MIIQAQIKENIRVTGLCVGNSPVNKFQWNYIQNFSFTRNASEKIVCEMAAISSRVWGGGNTWCIHHFDPYQNWYVHSKGRAIWSCHVKLSNLANQKCCEIIESHRTWKKKRKHVRFFSQPSSCKCLTTLNQIYHKRFGLKSTYGGIVRIIQVYV